MNRHQSNKMNMYRVVNAVLGQHQKTIDAIPPFSDTVTKFRDSLKVIFLRDNKYRCITAGATVENDDAFYNVADRLVQLANSISAFGRKTGNEQLKVECRISPSELRHYRKVELERRGALIGELAQIHAADIAAYGITEETIETFRKALETLRHRSDTQKQKIADSKAAWELLYNAFAVTDDILKKELDMFMELMKLNDIEFHNQYQAARMIIDHGGRTVKNDTMGNTETTAGIPSTESIAEPAIA
ncbi:MAG: hypothetical protein JW913_03730 [Chitinispirillaceae bacterium]|nr:hypothetical protein [Chitinispirillaceae bacterium]